MKGLWGWGEANGGLVYNGGDCTSYAVTIRDRAGAILLRRDGVPPGLLHFGNKVGEMQTFHFRTKIIVDLGLARAHIIDVGTIQRRGESPTTEERNIMSDIQYGNVKIDTAHLPPASIQALLSRGLAHYLGNEQNAKVGPEFGDKVTAAGFANLKALRAAPGEHAGLLVEIEK